MEQHRAASEILALREVLEIISESKADFGRVFDAILQSASRLCEAPLALLLLPAETGKHLMLKSHSGISASTVEMFERTPLEIDPDKYNTSVSLLEREPIQIEDLSDTDEYRRGEKFRCHMVDKEGARTILYVPLVQGDAAHGLLVLYRREIRRFDEANVSLVGAFANQAVIAIEKVRQHNELETRLQREAASREILEVVSQSRNDDRPVFDAILRRAAQLCRSPQAGLMMPNEARTRVRYVAGWGPPSKHFQVGVSEWSIDDPIAVTTAIRENRIVNIPDLLNDTLTREQHPSRLEIIEKEGIRSVLAVPLVSEGQAIGCFDVYRLEVDPFTDDEIALIQGFAAQAVIAIENVRQFKALEDLNAELGERVSQQVDEIGRMERLKRFLPSAVADTVISRNPESMLSSHRALLGVLFCDIRGFTAFCETAEPEETIEILQSYHEEMGKLINAHSAGVDLRMGDGIMVLFNDPLPCDDPAGEAVRLALAMRERMADLCRQWKRLGYRLGFGVGVSLGYATVGMVGFEGRFDYTASGTAINLASRLCDEAEDGEILLSPRASIAVENDFQVQSTGEVTLKGIREPVEVFRLVTSAG